jgi:hypothetical protein
MCSAPFGSIQPELRYCPVPVRVRFPFGGKVFAFPPASTVAGRYTIALLTIVVFIPFLPPGTIFGLLLAPGGKGMNCVELGTANGASEVVMVFGLITNETVCGSNGAFIGALQTTLPPALISICCGLYPKKG